MRKKLFSFPSHYDSVVVFMVCVFVCAWVYFVLKKKYI